MTQAHHDRNPEISTYLSEIVKSGSGERQHSTRDSMAADKQYPGLRVAEASSMPRRKNHHLTLPNLIPEAKPSKDSVGLSSLPYLVMSQSEHIPKSSFYLHPNSTP